MRNHIIYVISFLALVLVAAGTAKAQVAVSQMGFHPNAFKQVVVYGGVPGEFSIVSDSGQVAHTGSLIAPVDSSGAQATCQGGQQCVVGDFSAFASSGTYHIETQHGDSPDFIISDSVMADNGNLLMEFFEASLQQGSSYHADLHKAQSPPFTMMADGSFIMEANMATLPLIRLASAYARNPGMFEDRHEVSQAGEADIKEHIRMYVDYVEVLQDYTPAKDVSKGWTNDFNCGTVVPTEEKWNDAPEACMKFLQETNAYYTTSAMYALLKAIPALDSAKGQEVVGRAVSTLSFINQAYSLGTGDDAAFVGASLFLLYDYTGDSSYLAQAYSMRSKVPVSLSSEHTLGREFYWEEYIRHKSAIAGSGEPYEVDGKDPASFFTGKIAGDISRISRTGEWVYQYDNNIDFQNSRFMLGEALYAAKGASYDEGADSDVPRVAQMQLSWLTGMNRIQYMRGGTSMVSKSFIFGIGSNPVEFHSRLVSGSYTETGGKFINGKGHIPGWISGAYDIDGDGIFNHDDEYYSWRSTETTNEIVAQGIELMAYLDAYYNGLPSPPAGGGNITLPPVNRTNTTQPPEDGGVYYSVKDIPSTCSGGDIVEDTYGVGRKITCSGGGETMVVTAWNKPGEHDPQYFEMYRESGSGLSICLGTTCISGDGYAKSPSFPLPIAGSDPEPDDGAGEQEGNETGTPEPEVPSEGGSNACVASVEDIEADCEGGTISVDTFDGGRHITCESGGSSLSVDAWNKPGNHDPSYFEMYKVMQSGSGISICLGEACISSNGYARSSSFDACEDAGGDPEGEPEADGEDDVQEESETYSVELSVKQWYPKGNDYVFVCSGTGLGADSYRWEFGDGSGQVTAADNVYHSYDGAGTYTVSCKASGASGSASDEMDISVS